MGRVHALEHSRPPPRLGPLATSGRPAAALQGTRVALRGGRPLATSVRARFENRLGHSLADVRIHTGGAAADAARHLGTKAFTVGPNVVFGSGWFCPGTTAGDRLLGHELAHVVQQSTAPPSSPYRAIELGAGAFEQEADRVARQIASLGFSMRSFAPNLPRTAIPMLRTGREAFQAQFVTPLAAGGGFGGLMERDRHSGGLRQIEDVSVPAALQGGWRRIEDLSATAMAGASIAQRMDMLAQLIQAYWTGGAEEEAIIRVIEATPQDQASALIRLLSGQSVASKSYLQELDRVVDFGNNLELHASLSGLRIKAMGPKRGLEAMLTAPVLPWHDVMGFFEDQAVFFISRTRGGKVRVKYPARLIDSKDFGEEMGRLPVDTFTGGHDYESSQVLVIHDYDQGRFVPVVAEELIGYQRAGVRGFLGHVATVASFAIPVSATESVAGRIVVYGFERILPALFVLVDENRLNLVKWFPTWGPRMLYFADLAKVALAAYGVYRFAQVGSGFLRSWKEVRRARALLEGGSPSAQADVVARALEQQADLIFTQVDKLEAAEGAAAGLVERAPSAIRPLDQAERSVSGAVVEGGRATAIAAADAGAKNPSLYLTFRGGRALPKPLSPDRIYRICSVEEAAIALKTGRVPGAHAEGVGTPHKYFSLDPRYSALFKSKPLLGVKSVTEELVVTPKEIQMALALERKAASMTDKAAVGKALEDAKLLRRAAEQRIKTWYTSQGQSVILEVRLKPGTLEALLQRAVSEEAAKLFPGEDIFIFKEELGTANIAVPSWQLDTFNAKYLQSVELYGWRAPNLFGAVNAPEGVH